MKIAKRIFLLPVTPLIIVFAGWLVFKMIKESGYTEFIVYIETMGQEELPTDIKTWLEGLKPVVKPFLYALSTIGWFVIIKTIM